MPKVADNADLLYTFMPNECWMTESNMAQAIGISRRQVGYAKQYLLDDGRITIEERSVGKRANQMHILRKVIPILPGLDGGDSGWQLNWSLFDHFGPKDLERMTVWEQLEFYEEIGFQTIPLHYPKFKGNLVYCSCRLGRNCPSIGKHPAIAWKSLDFSDKRTYKAVRSYWHENINYNIGFRVDGFAVVDVDYRHGGHYSFGCLQDELGEIPVGLSAATGNGRHVYVQTAGNAIPNLTQAMGLPGLDVKSSGGLVTAPCSIHYTQNEYKWETVGEPGTLPESWTINLQDGGASAQTGTKLRPGSALPKLEPGVVIPDGTRSVTLFRFACRERGLGATEEQILDALETINATYCESPLPASALRSTAKSAAKYPTNAEKRGRLLAQNRV